VYLLPSLLEQVCPDGAASRSFIADLLPALLLRHTGMTVQEGHSLASGCSGKQYLSGPAEEHSLVGRQLNSIFPVMRLLNLVEGELGVGMRITETERRLFILALLLSPGDKVGLLSLTSVWDRPAIEQAKTMLEEQIRQCNGATFLPDLATYLEDIAFLALLTCAQEATPRSAAWQFQLPEQRILFLSRLCTFATQVATCVRSPRAIHLSPVVSSLAAILGELSEGKLELCYHQLSEVRGVLSGVINNGVQQALGKAGGIWPWLFFPDGTVYLKRTSVPTQPSSEDIVQAVKAELRRLCARRIQADGAGFKFSNQARAKHPDFYFEFLNIEEYAALLARLTILHTQNDISSKPLETLRLMQQAGDIDLDLPVDFDADLRIGLFARFLSVVFISVLGLLGGECADLREDVERAVVKHLGLEPHWEKSAPIPHKGGFDYRWFWLGACYLRDHPGLAIEGEQEESLARVFRTTMQLVCKLAGDELNPRMPRRYFTHLERYLSSVVEVSANLGGKGGNLPDVYAEIEHHSRSKERGGELVCTLCNSGLPTTEQRDSSVLFQPWVYKNKLQLHAKKNVGGICVICELELMLRQILPVRAVHRTGSKFEELRVKYLSVYPDPFFTLETGGMVQAYIEQLQDINCFAIRRQLGGKALSRADLLALESVTAPMKEAEKPQESPSSPAMEAVERDEEAQGQEASGSAQVRAKDWRYIKYLPGGQPGLFILGMQAGPDDDEAASWAMPAFLALVLPLVTYTKVVLSESPFPLFHSGDAFAATAIFDAPYSYLDRILKGGVMAGHEVFDKLRLLTSIYLVTMDVYSKKGKPGWEHLPGVMQDLETDPTRLFGYLLEQQKGESLYAGEAARYLHTYELLEADMSLIKQTVDNYVPFYRGGISSNSILAPVERIADAIIKSPPDTDPEDLQLTLQGLLSDWLERVRGPRAEGYALLWGKEKSREPELIEKFVRDFYQLVFLGRCEGERSQLQRMLNTFKTGCEVYYKQLRVGWHLEKQQGQERNKQNAGSLAEPAPIDADVAIQP